MRRRFKRFTELKGAQALAADPEAHAALSASAGTGKTQVLTARVLRLLLQGARPESILCLTFTKAAAAEMANRIGTRLAAWVRLKRSELWSDLEALGERPNERLVESATGSSTRIVRAVLLDSPLSIDRGEVTDKGSINQRAVLENRSALIEEIYSPSPPAQVITLQ